MNDTKPRPPVGGEIVPTRPSTGWRTYRIGAVTPARLTAMLAALDAGDVAEAMLFFEEMEEKDLHLGAVVQTRSLAAVSPLREVIPASDAADDRRIADFVREVYENIPRKRGALTALMSAVTHGFALAEIVWEVIDGAVVATELRPRPQRLFTFVDSDEPTRLLDFPRYVSPERPHGVDIPRSKFVYHRPIRGEDPLRAGLYRGIAWAYLFTNYTIKDWMTFLDLYGVPLRLGKFKPGADDAAREALRRAVRNLGSDAAAVISEETTIEFIHAALTGDHRLFREAAEFFNAQKSKRILGQTLTTESGSTGTYALGRVHDRVRNDLVVYDAAALDETLNHDLVRPLVDFNFGPRRAYPTIAARLENREEAIDRLDRIERLVRMGGRVSARVAAEAAGVPLIGDPEAPLTPSPKGA
jgi:phage gp29-like protein